MTDSQREFVDFLVETGALRFGEFTLKSGDRSPFFVNLGAIRTASALTRLGHTLARRLETAYPGTTLLFGPAYKGIAMATVTAVAHRELYGSDLAVCFDRKESKSHGEGGSFIGQRPTPADRVVVVDDVISNGGTKRAAMAALEAAFGVTGTGILVAVNRVRRRDEPGLKGMPLSALIDLGDLVTYLHAIDSPQADEIVQFYQEASDG